jgi:hypothetical protein
MLDISGIIQHHDAITGTAMPWVVADYENKISDAIEM